MDRSARIALGGRRPARAPKRLLALRSDAYLVDLVRAGDDVAFEVLYERHVAGILGFCRHMLGSQAEAEDAAQHAFVSAHSALRRTARDVALKPWLYTIARNRCLSVLRARREQPSELPELSTAGLSEEVERRADLRELVADVQRLPEQQRAALLLTELRDLSHAEVAEVLGCEVEAVKAVVFRARSAMIERRDARAADCGDIRMELGDATGGALRRSRLRYHLEGCPGCVAYLEELRRQRRLLAVALPVVPTLALHDSVMASAGVGAGAVGAAGAISSGGAAAGGAIAGGGTAAAGTSVLGGALAKVAIVGVLVGGAGAAEVVRHRDGGGASSGGPAQVEPRGAGANGGEVSSDARGALPATANGRAAARRAGRHGAERRALGQRRAHERSGGHAKAGSPPGLAKGGGGVARGRSVDNPGRALGRAHRNPGGGHAVTPPVHGGGQGANPPSGVVPKARSGAGGASSQHPDQAADPARGRSRATPGSPDDDRSSSGK